MGNPGQSKVATGNITPSSFVKLSTTLDGRCTICGAGERVFGVSGPSERQPPYDGLQDGYHAIAGENCKIFTAGARDVMLRLGGTVAPGDRLKADASGYGVATTTNLDEIGAYATVAGVSGQVIPVNVIGPTQISS
jgi:hypothetical protein